MNGFQKLIQSKTFFPVLVSLALMLVLIFLPTGYEGALSYQNADRVPALVLSTDESDITTPALSAPAISAAACAFSAGSLPGRKSMRSTV